MIYGFNKLTIGIFFIVYLFILRQGASLENEVLATKPTLEKSSSVITDTKSNGVSAEKAIGWLKNGNVRFVNQKFRKDGQSKQDRDRLVEIQNPHAIILSCSDSRIPPEIVFDQKLGEIFVIRTLGPTIDYTVIGSIEHAISRFSPRLLVILGHTQCGAITTALSVPLGGRAGSPSLDKMVADIQPRLKTTGEKSPQFIRESTLNIQGISKELMDKSLIIRSAVEKGDLEIHTAIYYLNSGQVLFQ